MYIVRAKQIIAAFMNKLVIRKMIAMMPNFSNFSSLDGKEIGCELQTVVVRFFSFLHNNFQTRLRIFYS